MAYSLKNDYFKSYLAAQAHAQVTAQVTPAPAKPRALSKAQKRKAAEEKRRAAKAAESRAVLVARPNRALLRRIQRIRRLLSVRAGGANVSRNDVLIYMLNEAADRLDHML